MRSVPIPKGQNSPDCPHSASSFLRSSYAAQGMELQVIAAVVVGGVNIFGGQGTMFGALLGALLINILQQSLIRWISISAFWIDALLGALILTAVATDALIIGRLRTLWARSEVKMVDADVARAETGK